MIETIALDALRARIVAVFPAQIRECVGRLSDEELWWRPNEGANSVGNLILHLTGSLNYFINRNLGGIDFVRDRDAEFSERGPVSREELLAHFDQMVSRAEETLAALTPERLNDASPEPKLHRIVIEDLITVATHLATHMGQIIWITKALHEGSLSPDTWPKAHRSHGAWR